MHLMGVQVFHRYSAMPAQHPSALQQQLAAAVDMVGQDNVTGALEVLANLVEWQLEDYVAVKPSDTFVISDTVLAAGGGGSSSLRELVNEAYNAAAAGSSPAAVYLVPACIFAVMLDTHDPNTMEVNKQRASSSSSSSRPDSPDSQADSSSSSTPMDTAADDEMFDAVPDSSSDRSSSSSISQRSISSSSDSPLQRLVKFQLEALTRDAPQDSLAPLAAALQVRSTEHVPAPIKSLLTLKVPAMMVMLERAWWAYQYRSCQHFISLPAACGLLNQQLITHGRL